MNLQEQFKGKKVFITGSTGFKGSWLSFLLTKLGAEVKSIGLPNGDRNTAFNQLHIKDISDVTYFDLRNRIPSWLQHDLLNSDYVFHFAAQAIVSEGYANPKYTFDTNIGGTINLLEEIKYSDKEIKFLSVASDRVYAPTEGNYSHKEEDSLGGCYDPYSVSKVIQNQLVDSYRRLPDLSDKVTLINARTSNVIGGGDRGKNRLMTSIQDAYEHNKPVELRNPSFSRQYIYVLDCLCSYLYIIAKGIQDAYNIGAGDKTICTVQELVDECKKYYTSLESTNTGKQFGFEGSALSVNTERFHNEFTEVQTHIAKNIGEIIKRTLKYNLADNKVDYASQLVEEALEVYSI